MFVMQITVVALVIVIVRYMANYLKHLGEDELVIKNASFVRKI
jgi:hypothetical protein